MWNHPACGPHTIDTTPDAASLRHATHAYDHQAGPERTGGVLPGGDKINGNGPLWRTWQNLAGVRAQPWFGYAGGWGSPGANGVLSGPSAPPTHPAPQFKSGKCDEN